MEEKQNGQNKANKDNEQVKRQAEGRIYLILAVVWIVLAVICHEHLIEMIVFAAVGLFMAVRGALKIKGAPGKKEE